jgi:hypothetical protein
LTQLSNKVSLGTEIGAVVTTADVTPAPGSVMAELIGGPQTSDPDTAKTWTTSGAGLLKLTVSICVALTGALT